MLNNKREFTLKYGDRDVTVETGRLAKQADGAALVSCGGTQVLVTVVSAKDANPDADFFPLLVDYKEKFYAAGKFLGGFIKREGRPSNSEILLMRMVDRPFRPLFPKGYYNETIIQATVHSFDPEVDPGILAGLGASAALRISDVPFAGPVGFCKVGKVDGKLVINPPMNKWDESELELVVAATDDAVLMIEGEANQVAEDEMVEAILAGHQEIKKYCQFIKDIVAELGAKKRDFSPRVLPPSIVEGIDKRFSDKARDILNIVPKLERQDAISELEKQAAADMEENGSDYGLASEDAPKYKALARQGVDELLYKIMREDIVENGRRIGNRPLTQVREIETETDIFKRTHGSALFTRGETQVLATVTLGGKDGEQMSDSILGIEFSRFYLHYTFAPYCVGEARGYRGVGRREIGHGNLAERALKRVSPTIDKFPYTVRVACEVTESNGSSSMGSVCSGSMALMDAGVPLEAPVAGVAMGLIKENDKFVILTDILGDEDHLGDMDFKVAGTKKGITAIQMDIKISGIPEEVFQKAMAQAKDGRLHILAEMEKTISGPRQEMKHGVPRIRSTKIAPDKIGALIGPSGKNVKMIQEEYQVSVEVKDDGSVFLTGVDVEKLDAAIELINLQITGPKVGTDYTGTVVAVKEYGAFVDIAANISGLVHVSEISDGRIQDVAEYVKEGQKIEVKVLEVDRFGKIKLSAKAVKPLPKL